MLKPPGTLHLKLTHDRPLSNVAFNVNLRRYSMDYESSGGETALIRAAGLQRFTCVQTLIAVGRCRLTVYKPMLKAPVVSALDL